jgi:hypothetical protein
MGGVVDHLDLTGGESAGRGIAHGDTATEEDRRFRNKGH